MFYLTRFAMAHLKSGAEIINTASITAFAGNPKLIDYSSTKGGIVSAKSLVTHGVRVNAIARAGMDATYSLVIRSGGYGEVRRGKPSRPPP